MNGAWAIVPAKRFERAKARLAPILSEDERAELARLMFQEVMATLTGTPGFGGIMVVTGDPLASEIARTHGAETIDEKIEGGTNLAVKFALQKLVSRNASGVVVIPSDVPQAKAADLGIVLSALRPRTVLLVPDASEIGTNLLAAAPADLIEPCFGPDSFPLHRQAARQAGVGPQILDLESLRIDIDQPKDLLAFLALNSNTKTHHFIAGLDIPMRLTQVANRALSALGSQPEFQS